MLWFNQLNSREFKKKLKSVLDRRHLCHLSANSVCVFVLNFIVEKKADQTSFSSDQTRIWWNDHTYTQNSKYPKYKNLFSSSSVTTWCDFWGIGLHYTIYLSMISEYLPNRQKFIIQAHTIFSSSLQNRYITLINNNKSLRHFTNL